MAWPAFPGALGSTAARFPAGDRIMAHGWAARRLVGRYPGWRIDPCGLPESLSFQWL